MSAAAQCYSSAAVASVPLLSLSFSEYFDFSVLVSDRESSGLVWSM